MSHNINEIRSQLEFGGARSSQFQVQFTNPISGIGDLKTPVMVRASSIPPAIIGTIRVPYFGRTIVVPGDAQYPDWNVTVINDEDFKIRHGLEVWHNSMNAHQRNITLSGPRPINYLSQAIVTAFGKDGRTLRTYQFNNIYPTEISPIEVDWAAQDQIQEYQVSFAYDYWEVIEGDTGGFPV